jgi:hypothetical protein
MIRALSRSKCNSSSSSSSSSSRRRSGLVSITSRLGSCNSVQNSRKICQTSYQVFQRNKQGTSSIGRYSFAIGIALATSLYIQNNYDHNALKVECKSSEATDEELRTDFYPEIRPYQSGRLSVSKIHTIAYSVYGNPNGKPVVYLHGGPGSGSKPCTLYPLTRRITCTHNRMMM